MHTAPQQIMANWIIIKQREGAQRTWLPPSINKYNGAHHFDGQSFSFFFLLDEFLSVMIIPDCQLTAFILDTVWALIKNTSTLLYLSLSLSLSALLFVSASHFIWPPYLKVDAGSVSDGQVECCVLFVCTLYQLSSISLCSGRTICLLLSVGRDRLNGMGWSLQGLFSPQTTVGKELACGSWRGLTRWWQDDMKWPWNLIGYYGSFTLHLNIQ